MTSQVPEHYSDDRAIAIVRDPSTLFVYWDLEDSWRAHLEARLGGEMMIAARWFLRLTNCDTSAISDIEINIEARNWYATVVPGCSYDVEIGVICPAGNFHGALACGNVHMPPLSYCGLFDKEWAMVEEDYLHLLALGGASFLGSSFDLHSPDEYEETPWVAHTGHDEMPEPQPTSPGVPTYTTRR